MDRVVYIRIKLMLHFLPFSSPSLERQTPRWLSVIRKSRLLFYSSTLRLLTLFSDVVLEILSPITHIPTEVSILALSLESRLRDRASWNQ